MADFTKFMIADNPMAEPDVTGMWLTANERRIIMNELTEYLRTRLSLLNPAEVARRIKFDAGNLHRAIHGEKDSKGVAVKIPKRCEAALKILIKELQTDII